MKLQYSRAEVRQAADFVAARTTLRPEVGLVLGSGLSSVADEVAGAKSGPSQRVVIPYADIPHFPRSTVEGHSGQLVLGLLAGCPVAVMQGRVHYYEGYTMQQVTFPIRVLWALGVKYLILTNAAGGLNPSFAPGDLMLIDDHIGLANMVGLNPLIGPNDAQIGPRFPDMSRVYDLSLREMTLHTAERLGIPLVQGVYIMLSGPTYETPADLRFLRLIGADAVGMSTVPEATVAHHAGIRVLGISGISNIAPPEPGSQPVSHEEVLEAGKLLAARLGPLLKEILRQLVQKAADGSDC